MLKSKITNWASVAAFVFVFASCGSTKISSENSAEFNMISGLGNYSLIASMDLLGMVEKSGFEKMEEVPAHIGQMFQGIKAQYLSSENTGVDLNRNNHFVFSMEEGGKEVRIYAFLKLMDKEKAVKYISSQIHGKVTEKEGYSMLKDEFSGLTAAFDNNWMVVLYSSLKENTEDKLDLVMKSQKIEAATNQPLSDYLLRKDDINYFVNLNASAQIWDGTENKEVEIDEELKNVYKDGYTMASVNFENGKIVAEGMNYGENLLNSKFNIFNAQAVSKDFLNYLGDGQIFGFAALSLNPKGFLNIIDHISIKNEKDNAMLHSAELKQQIESVFTGEMTFSLVDVMEVQNDGAGAIEAQFEAALEEGDFDFDYESDFDYSEPKTEPIFLGALGVKSVKSLDQLLASVGVVPANGIYNFEDVFGIVVNDKLVISNSKDYLDVLIANGKLSAYAINGKMETPFYGEANLNLTKLPEGLKKLAGDNEMGMLLGDLEGLNFEGDMHHSRFEITFASKDKNPLQILLKPILKKALGGPMGMGMGI